MPKRRRRVLVIGLDGATWQLIEPLTERGHLPHLKSLLDSSRRGVLRATFPPVTAPSWTSFATGVNPGRHGVFDFFELEPGRYRKRIVDLSRWPVDPIWRRVEAAGRRAVVVNFPALHPAEVGRGVSIAGMMARGMSSSFFEPRSLYHELRRELGEYEIDAPWPGGGEESLPAYFAAVERCTRNRGRWAERILRGAPWDLALVVFVTPDRLQHKAWSALIQASRCRPARGSVGEAALRAFAAMDEAIGALVLRTGPRDDVLVASDHGFGSAHGVFEPNVFLAEAGLLVRRPLPLAAVRIGKATRSAWRRVPLVRRRRSTGAGVGDATTGQAFESLVDWSRSRAFALSATDMGIYLNTRGRFPEGIVSPGVERESVVRDLIAAFEDARNPSDGSRLRIRAIPRESIFSGPFVELAPDLLFVVEGGSVHCGTRVDGSVLHEAGFLRGDGNHRLEGIYAHRGEGVAPGTDSRGVEMVDMAPTILERMGIGGGEEMEGAPL
ncbi:MAG: hypothetical protein CME06_16290 [Gemmatimonadetes bacterium]|nr:hypothetical protein [Gemmatimonadota bacterium]